MPQNAKKVIRPLTVREVLTLINSLSEHLQTFQGDRDFACDWCGRVLHEHEDESQACPAAPRTSINWPDTIRWQASSPPCERPGARVRQRSK